MKTRNFALTTRWGRRITIALLAVAIQSVQADGIIDGFEMRAVSDLFQGQHLVAGRYRRAISMNRVHDRAILNNADPERVFPFAVSTNLCVAHTMLRELDKARVFCDASVRSAQSSQSGHDRDATKRADRVVALSNRAVLRALAGDEKAAREDLAEALMLESGAWQATRNLARLNAPLEAFAGQ